LVFFNPRIISQFRNAVGNNLFARVIYQSVKSTQFVDGILNYLFTEIFVSDIPGQSYGGTSGIANYIDNVLGIFLLGWKEVQGNISTFPSESYCHRSTNSGVCAGN